MLDQPAALRPSGAARRRPDERGRAGGRPGRLGLRRTRSARRSRTSSGPAATSGATGPTPCRTTSWTRVLASGPRGAVGRPQPALAVPRRAGARAARAGRRHGRPLPARAGRRRCDPDAGRQLLGAAARGHPRGAGRRGRLLRPPRAAPRGVLGRATFPDADVWSCACAIQNMWLTARAEGLGLGWVTLFDPDELAAAAAPARRRRHARLALPRLARRAAARAGPAAGGLVAAGAARRRRAARPLARRGRPGRPAVAAAGARPGRVVAARDAADVLLTPPSSLGVLDRAVDRALALGLDARPAGGTLVLAVGRHGVVRLGVSAFAPSVTEDVLAASRAGTSLRRGRGARRRAWAARRRRRAPPTATCAAPTR